MYQLELKSVVKISDLVDILNVSMDTVRRDLKQMENEGLLSCVRGGACLPEKIERFSNFTGREVINIELKREAAKKAVKYINDDDVIFLNSGTTNTILAQELAERPVKCTVVTNNMAVVSVLMMQSNIKVIVIGGDIDPLEKSVYGGVCERELSTYYFDIAFLSINAANLDKGYTDFRLNEITIMQNAVLNAKKVIAVMDSSKFGKVAKKLVFKCDAVDLIVTDDHFSHSQKEKLVKKGIDIV